MPGIVLEKRYERLRRIIGDIIIDRNSKNKRAIIAFSGGVDSSVVARIARDVSDDDNIIAVTIDSEIVHRRTIENSKRIADEIGIRHFILRKNFLDNSRIVENSIDRCYYCKKNIIREIKKFGKIYGISVILDGTNADDMNEFRPGIRALKEENVASPLADAGIGKREVREIARFLGLSNFNAASESCLATRIPLNEKITYEKLRMVESAEEFLWKLGISYLRVRNFDGIAIIETLPEDIEKIIYKRDTIYDKLIDMGFRRVCVDIGGVLRKYRTLEI